MSYHDDPDYQDWLNELMENAGDEWDDDMAMEEIALRYVRHLEAVTATPDLTPLFDALDAYDEAKSFADEALAMTGIRVEVRELRAAFVATPRSLP